MTPSPTIPPPPAIAPDVPVPPAPGASQAPTPAPADLTATAVDQLILGRQLRYPIYDPNRVLLLAEGSTVTQDFKDLLGKWKIQTVQLHNEDIGNLTAPTSQACDAAAAENGGEATSKLDRVIESGVLFTVNTGPAVGRRAGSDQPIGHDAAKHDALLARHKESSGFVDALLDNALQGQEVDLDRVAEIASPYVDEMRTDLDNVLATVFSAPGGDEIAEQCLKTALLGMAIAVEMGMDEENVRRIGTAGLVHDWGMARVPESIRTANRPLSDVEFLEIARHPDHTVNILEGCRRVPTHVSLIAYQVHERPSGRGYPRNRTGDLIHIGAKILGVADAYRALVTPRAYRPPLKAYAAMECLIRQASAGDMDSQVVRALLRLMSLFPVGSFVSLSDGSVARVIRTNGTHYMQPVVLRTQDPSGAPVSPSDPKAVVDLLSSKLKIVQALPSPGSNEVGLSNSVLDLSKWRQSEVADPAQAEAAGREVQASGTTDTAGTAATDGRVTLENYSPEQKDAVQCALDTADNCALRIAWRFDQHRKHQRVAVRTVVNVSLAPSLGSCGSSFRAMARDVSQGGLAFLHPVCLDDKDVLVGIDLPNGSRQWFQAEIVRRRAIESSGFWEYGVAFRRRVIA